jgi:hypothetical protein
MKLIWRAGEGEMNFKWFGPLALLAALVIGDQIRINRPGHKYRLTVEVETPGGVKSGSGVLAITPDRGYSRRGNTSAFATAEACSHRFRGRAGSGCDRKIRHRGGPGVRASAIAAAAPIRFLAVESPSQLPLPNKFGR